MPYENDNELIIACKQGNRQAFNQLVLRHQTMVYRVIRKMINDHEAAMDIAQDTFLKAWQSMDTFRGDALVSTWLYRISTNLCLNYLRRLSLRTFFRIEDVEHTIAEEDESGPDKQMEEKEHLALIEKAVARLPKKQRAVFVLRYYEELPYQEISTILNTSVGALKANYFHAIRKIESFVRHEL